MEFIFQFFSQMFGVVEDSIIEPHSAEAPAAKESEALQTENAEPESGANLFEFVDFH